MSLTHFRTTRPKGVTKSHMADEALNNAKDELHRERTILVEQKKNSVRKNTTNKYQNIKRLCSLELTAISTRASKLLKLSGELNKIAMF